MKLENWEQIQLNELCYIRAARLGENICLEKQLLLLPGKNFDTFRSNSISKAIQLSVDIENLDGRIPEFEKAMRIGIRNYRGP